MSVIAVLKNEQLILGAESNLLLSHCSCGEIRSLCLRTFSLFRNGAQALKREIKERAVFSIGTLPLPTESPENCTPATHTFIYTPGTDFSVTPKMPIVIPKSILLPPSSSRWQLCLLVSFLSVPYHLPWSGDPGFALRVSLEPAIIYCCFEAPEHAHILPGLPQRDPG